MTTAEAWAREYVSPPSFTACGHHNSVTTDGVRTCRDCGHHWTEHSIYIPDDEYDTLLAYVAFRLDSNK